MIDKLTTENLRDFRQRYSGSYGWLHNTKEKRLVFISEVGESEVKFQDEKGFTFQVAADSPVDFEFTQVFTGWFAGDKRPTLAMRVPARQYCRGISTQNTRFYHGTSDGIRNIAFSFNEIYNCLTKREAKIYNKEQMVLSKNFAVDSNTVFARNIMIGSYNGGTIKLVAQAFHQELVDVIRRNGLDIKVELE